MKLIPAILVDQIPEYIRQIKNAEGYTDEVDVDIIDWSRTHRKTLSLERVLSVPTCLKLNLDLMVDHPSAYKEMIIRDERVYRIILNTESKDGLSDQLDFYHNYDKQCGISLCPEDSVADFAELIFRSDIVQIFTIEPGAQGNEFLYQRLEEAHNLRQLGFKGVIEVDGSFNADTLELFAQYPLDYISVGSALAKATDPALVYQSLTAQLEALIV